MKRIIFAICTLLCANVLWAQNLFTVGDIQYEITGTNEVEVDSASTSATSIVIPETIDYEGITYNVTSIDAWAFDSHTNLTSVTIPNSIVSIGKGAFYGCTGLTSMDIPNSVTTIDTLAFYGCTGLTSITIPNSITSIKTYTFSGCSSLTSITIPNSIVSIGKGAFYDCTGLTSMDIPNSVTTIDTASFCGCAGLTSINIPNSITSIKAFTFYGCSSLTSITIPNSIVSIGERAFYGCTGLTSVTIPESVTSINDAAFLGNTNLTTLHFNAIHCDFNLEQYLVFPNTINNVIIGENVEKIPNNFLNHSKITNVTIPNSVDTIEWWAFGNCSLLTDVTLGSDLVSLGYNAFGSDSNLIRLNYNATNCTSFNQYAFGNSTRISIINIGNNVETIPAYFAYNLDSLAYVTIPANVTSLGNSAFYDCDNLASVTCNAQTAPNLGSDAFSSNYYYNTLSIPFCNVNQESYTSSAWNNRFRYIQSSSHNGLAYQVISGTNNLRVIGLADGSITNLVIPSTVECNGTIYNVTQIDEYAFYNCSSLTSVTIPNSVTYIGEGAFYYCSNLAEVTMPENINIDYDAFYNAGAPAKITIDSVLYKVSNSNVNFFAECGLITFHIGDSTYTPTEAFVYDCEQNRSGHVDILSSVEINGNTYPVTSIGDGAFGSCSSLTSVNIPNSVTSIGRLAFYNCSSLTSIVIPNSVTSVGVSNYSYFYEAQGAFERCTSLTEVTLPENATIPSSTFRSAGIYPTIITDGVTYEINAITNPGNYTFEGLGLITFHIGDSTYAPTEAFVYACEQSRSGHVDILSSIEVGENTYPVTSIGGVYFYYDYIMSYDAFSNCSSITSVNIPNSVTSIGESAFSGCSGLTSVTFEDNSSLDSIGNYAFEDCDGLTSITLPNSVTSIGYAAFRNCSGLTSITLPNSVTSIGNYAFEDCSGLTSITLPNSVTSIGDGAFSYCSGLTSVTFEDNSSLDSIGNYVFSNCSGLTSITLPNSVTSIGESAFRNCSGLTSITLPNSVTSIGEVAFINCSSLTSITLPNSVTSIGNYVFYNCSGLTSITLPESITSIGSGAFHGCSFLQNITCLSTTPPTMTSNDVFPYPNMAFVSVPCGSLSAYTAPTSFWNLFFMGRISELNFALNLVVNNSDWGTVNMERTNCSTVILTATANTGYHFEGWSDGETANPRTLVMTEDTEITAIFEEEEIVTYNVTASVNNEVMGSVEGSGIYVENTTATLNAVANYGYHFVAWSDGETANPRTITVTSDVNLTANFAINTYELVTNVNNQSMGSVTGAGEYDYLSQVTITAMANVGHHFVAWADGNTNNPRTIILTSDSVVTANFDINTYTITANVENSAMGSVNGGGEYDYGTTATLTAIPNSCFNFVAWNDGNTDNPRNITVGEDATFTASFEAIVYESVLNVSICEGSNYNENGFNVSEAGTYTQTFVTANGCDSVVTLNLSVNSVVTNELFATICEGSVYTENNFNVSEAGVYTQNLTSVNGCDSIVTLTLNVNPTFNTELSANICQGQVYNENGFNVSEGGVYTQTLTSVNGCDSIVTLTLTVNPIYNTELTATICEGSVYTENNFNVSEAGVYTQNLTSVNGCDSIVTLTLNVNPTFNTELSANICQGQVYNENGFNVSEAGVYTQNLQTANGCDSIVTLTLNVNPIYNTELTATICEGSVYTENNFNVSEAGIYTQTLTSANGCDSIVTLTLNVNPTFNTELSANICQGQVYNENGFNVSEAGVYTQNLTSVNGCDSIVTLTVSVNPVFDTTINATINTGETYAEFGFNESESGTYVQNLQTVNGCDSTITLNLTVNSSLYDVAELTEITFYPNPTSGKVTFSKEIEKIEVIDNIGKIVMRFFDTNEIDIETLPSGAYYLRMMIGDKTIMRKVIKE